MTERVLRIVNENMPEIIGFDDFRHEAVKALFRKSCFAAGSLPLFRKQQHDFIASLNKGGHAVCA